MSECHAIATHAIPQVAPKEEPVEGSALLGISPAMKQLRSLCRRLSGADATVLIRGESGSGKELVAQELHYSGRRAAAPFVAVNCAAISPGLVESELFGHERGSFTHAVARHVGKLEAAGAGTLLLDEVAELAPDLQAKLLRALETRRFQRVGGMEEITLRARVLAATHQDLERRIADGRFREDLFYRLNVVTVPVPPLRERLLDIPLLATHFLRQVSPRPLRLSRCALGALQQRPWPGNVRELRNAVERLALLCDGEELTAETVELLLPPAVSAGQGRGGPIGELERLLRELLQSEAAEEDRLEQVQFLMVQLAMELCGNNRVRAARRLGVGRKTVERRWHRLRQLHHNR